MLSMQVDYFRCVFYQKQIISLLLSRVRSLYGIRISWPTLLGHHNIPGYIMVVSSTMLTRYGWILSMRSWNLEEKEINPSWLKYITTLIRQQNYERSTEYECCMGSSISVILWLQIAWSWIMFFWWAMPSRLPETNIFALQASCFAVRLYIVETGNGILVPTQPSIARTSGQLDHCFRYRMDR